MIYRGRKQSLLCKKIIAFLELCPGSWEEKEGCVSLLGGSSGSEWEAGRQEAGHRDADWHAKEFRFDVLDKGKSLCIENKAIMWSDKHDQSQRGGQEHFSWSLSLFLNLEISSTFHHQCQTFLHGV